MLLRAQQQQVASDDFRAVFPLPVLPILPTRGLKVSLDIKLRTLGNVFADDLRETLPSHTMSRVRDCPGGSDFECAEPGPEEAWLQPIALALLPKNSA